MQIVGYTDKNYMPLAKQWYEDLMRLGYTRDEVILVCHDAQAFDELQAANITVEPAFIANPDYRHMVLGFWQQLMAVRLNHTRQKLQSGTSLLISDVDNVFMTYVPLYQFYEEGYDVIHAYEMQYPPRLFARLGFVVCSGLQWLRATNETIRFLDQVLAGCNNVDEKCDDQVAYNAALLHSAQIQWDQYDGNPNQISNKVPRTTNSSRDENNGLLYEEMTGVSATTNHTVKIWSRDFAFRHAGEPHQCPPRHSNWVAMPTKLDFPQKLPKLEMKLRTMQQWRDWCDDDTGSKRIQTT